MTGRLEGLRAAVELSPDNHALRLVLAEALFGDELLDEALTQFQILLEADALPTDQLVAVGWMALDQGRLALSARCLERARKAGVTEGTVPLRERLQDELAGDGVARRADGPQVDDEDADGPTIARLVDRLDQVTFADVGGLDAVKKAIHKQIILPFQRPDLYEKYGRRAGGGVLL